MTDVHCHVSANDDRVREFLIGRDFFGIHPWDVGTDPVSVGTDPSVSVGTDPRIDHLRALLRERPNVGVGEIGLDRLKNKQISIQMRELFLAQLKLAREFHRPVVLHGAKCWGEVVRALGTDPKNVGTDPIALGTDPGGPYLFHGFSRSDGLLPDIQRLNGFISVGPAVLNDHAVNYRELVRKIPDEMLLVETDRTIESAPTCPGIREILEKLAQIRGTTFDALERLTDNNADCFSGAIRHGSTASSDRRAL